MKLGKIIIILCLLMLIGCLDKKTYKTYQTGDYCKPVDWCPFNLDGKWGWEGDEWTFEGPCGETWHCKIVCEPVGTGNPVPAPSGFILAAIGTGVVAWTKRRRIS